VFRLFIHIIFAFTVSFSTGGFWINNHYCQDKLVDTSLFFGFGNCCEGEAESCCAAEASGHCDTEKTSCNKKSHEEKDGCCDNKSSFHKLDQNLDIQKIKFKSFNSLSEWNAIIPTFNILLPKLDKHTFQYFNYTPPLIVFDPQVWLHTFLC
jgi:hypothetical protein